MHSMQIVVMPWSVTYACMGEWRAHTYDYIYNYIPVHLHTCNTSWPVSNQTSYQMVGILGYLDQVSSSVE